jgi:5-formyltetrahydrofolate cyclo-ligase
MEAIRRKSGDVRVRLNGHPLLPLQETEQQDVIAALTEALCELPAAIEARLCAANEAQIAAVREAVLLVNAALPVMDEERRQFFGDLTKQTGDLQALTGLVAQLADEMRSGIAQIEQQINSLLKAVAKVSKGQQDVVDTLNRPVVAFDEIGNRIGVGRRE